MLNIGFLSHILEHGTAQQLGDYLLLYIKGRKSSWKTVTRISKPSWLYLVRHVTQSNHQCLLHLQQQRKSLLQKDDGIILIMVMGQKNWAMVRQTCLPEGMENSSFNHRSKQVLSVPLDPKEYPQAQDLPASKCAFVWPASELHAGNRS